MAITTFTLRHALRPGDRPAIAALLEATAVFRPDEVAVALDLVDDTLSLGAQIELSLGPGGLLGRYGKLEREAWRTCLLRSCRVDRGHL